MNQSSSRPALASDIILKAVRGLTLRNKLALGYILVFTLLVGGAFYSIYRFSENYRKEEFYHRLRDRTLTTFKILLQVDEIDRKTLQLFDRNTINSLNAEQVLLFDSAGLMMYSSVENPAITHTKNILTQLRKGEDEIKLTDKDNEILATRFNYKGTSYFGIAKAYDRFGRSKLKFLKFLLIAISMIVTLVLTFVSFYLSNIITSPITRLTKNIDEISPDSLNIRLSGPVSGDEVGFLAAKFNELLAKVENAFKFQYHFIHHLSHELKTPLAVMMTNAERALTDRSEEVYRNSLEFQKSALMELSYIINAMLDISKTESQLLDIHSNPVRLDELLFECMDEVNFLNSETRFDFQIDSSIDTSEKLTVLGNSRMLKMAFMNLLKNAVNFSTDNRAGIDLALQGKNITIAITNDGAVISEPERTKLFMHLFRGENSKHVKGFGLGLVLSNRIIALHQGSLQYDVTEDHKNRFILQLPLA